MEKKIEVKKLRTMNHKSVKQKILVFLKRNKKWAYRPCEIVRKLKSNNNSVSDGLKKLLKEGKVEKESIYRNCAYYNYIEQE